jgi:exopolyphosphatase / guanosine-5'-triphosphate,3'-diphosphate pyrophosphatase
LNRVAALDIGTNSIRCIVAEGEPSGRFRVLDDEKATVRLGEGLASTGELSQSSMERGLEALSRMRKIVDSYRVGGIEAVATSAVRSATNGQAFIEAALRETGIEISVISGEEEGALAALSAANEFDLGGTSYGVVDLGGGSVEIVVAFGSHPEEIVTLDLGAVILTERFLRSDPPSKGEYDRLRRHVRGALRDKLPNPPPAVRFLVGSGGTVNALGNMAMAMRRERYPSVQGYELFHADVVHLLAGLRHADPKERRKFPGLHEDRADIIVAGVAVVDAVMRHLGVNLLKVNERGVREGLILRGLRRHGIVPDTPRARNWRESVLQFAESCRFHEEHSLQVARLALLIFDAVAPSAGMGEPERRLLEAAAILHDIGYLISYTRHHKHSSLLIRHADLFGFTPRERDLIATVARYHRKALPCRKHEEYARLSPDDRLLVERLSGILRLADGLDRRRTGRLSRIDCSCTDDTLVLRVEGEGDLSVELFGGREKGDLFERVFGWRLKLVAA